MNVIEFPGINLRPVDKSLDRMLYEGALAQLDAAEESIKRAGRDIAALRRENDSFRQQLGLAPLKTGHLVG